MKKGLLITVNFKNWDTTEQFIISLKLINENRPSICIVDNSPLETNFELLKEDIMMNQIYYIASEKNLGYFGAAKLAIEKYGKTNYDYIIVCNNDVRIISDNFFRVLELKIEKYDVIAPCITTINGIRQNPHRSSSISLSRKLFYKLYYLNFYIAKLLSKLIGFKKANIKNDVIEQERIIYSPHGAFIVFSKSYFQKGGEIDSGYFLYGEEDSIVGQADRCNLSIGYIPQLHVKHYESISTGKGLSKSKYKYQKQAFKFINEKYGLFKF